MLFAFGLKSSVDGAIYVACGVKLKRSHKAVQWAGPTNERACLLLKRKFLAHCRAAQRVRTAVSVLLYITSWYVNISINCVWLWNDVELKNEGELKPGSAVKNSLRALLLQRNGSICCNSLSVEFASFILFLKRHGKSLEFLCYMTSMK